MADKHSPEVRSYNMSQIKDKNTKPEMLIRKFLFANGFRYRLHDKKLPGKPDIVLPKYKTVIFVNGCFWHGHENCRYFKLPKTRADWWRIKIQNNKIRDELKKSELRLLNWKIIVVWECEIKNQNIYKTLIREIKKPC